ncbi:hypothetical protein JM664_14240 [Rhodobacteraceae bacterium MCCB 386]|nr:hypothetical protein [Roseitranquillus sediminis]
MVLSEWRAVIFVDGWLRHRHGGWSKATTPSTRRSF